MIRARAADLGIGEGAVKGAPKIIDVPAQFGDPAKSGTKITVNKGANTFDIVIPK